MFENLKVRSESPANFEIVKPSVRLVSIQDKIDPGYLESLGITPEQKEHLAKGGVDALVAYIARVSSPNQANQSISRLIKYCMDHGHVSILEQANATFEIETTRDISAQLIRHRSFNFQEFSQRYAEVSKFGELEARLQDTNNRQNSIEVDNPELQAEVDKIYQKVLNTCVAAYQAMLDSGIAKEVARKVLPINAKTKLYMTGNIRNWIFYIKTRAFGEGVQKEHRQIALAIAKELQKHIPIISEAFNFESEIEKYENFNL